MPNSIQLKHRLTGAGPASAPDPNILVTAEPAYDENGDVLWIGIGDNGTGTATNVRAVGGRGYFMDLFSSQVIAGSKSFASNPTVPNLPATDASGRAVNSAFVAAQFPSLAPATGTKITYNSQGLIVSSGPLIASDIPSIVSTQVSDFLARVYTARLDQLANPTAPVNFNGQAINNIPDPIMPQDPATKNYVDVAVQGLSPKASVNFATAGTALSSYTRNGNVLTSSANIALTMDGFNPTNGQRVLIKDETTAANNGIYVVTQSGNGSVPWVLTRSADFDTWNEATGAFTFVTQGTANAETGWVCASTPGGTLGVSAIAFVQFSSAGIIIAGAGLARSGNTIVAVGTANRIAVSQSSIDIAANYAGQISINTVGTITTGAWQGSAVGLSYGGTGSNLAGAPDGTIFKKVGLGLVPAVANTDYLAPGTPIFGGTF